MNDYDDLVRFANKLNCKDIKFKNFNHKQDLMIGNVSYPIFEQFTSRNDINLDDGDLTTKESVVSQLEKQNSSQKELKKSIFDSFSS